MISPLNINSQYGTLSESKLTTDSLISRTLGWHMSYKGSCPISPLQIVLAGPNCMDAEHRHLLQTLNGFEDWTLRGPSQDHSFSIPEEPLN